MNFRNCPHLAYFIDWETDPERLIPGPQGINHGHWHVFQIFGLTTQCSYNHGVILYKRNLATWPYFGALLGSEEKEWTRASECSVQHLMRGQAGGLKLLSANRTAKFTEREKLRLSQVARGRAFCLFSKLWASPDTQGDQGPGGWILCSELNRWHLAHQALPVRHIRAPRESRGCALPFPAVFCAIERSRIQTESSTAERTLHNQPVCRPTRRKCMVMYWQHVCPQAFPDAGGRKGPIRLEGTG